jgi:hypothetical protein
MNLSLYDNKLPMSDVGAANKPETSHVSEPKNQSSKVEKGETPPAKTRRKPSDGEASSDSSTKTLQELQRQISRVDDTTANLEKQLKVLDKIQSEVSRFEGRLTQIERTSHETLSIVQQIKLKKGKGKDKKKNKK